MSPDRTAQRIEAELFADPDAQAFAILDGASVPGLRRKLWQHEPDHYCLFREVATAALAEAAPYVVQLREDSQFTRWVLAEGWGNHWGVLATAPADLRAMRRHCRALVDAYDPEGRPVIFRYYDPRVLRVFLPACTGGELREMFGPVACFLVEDADRGTMLRHRLDGGLLRVEKVKLSVPAEALQPVA